jgi:hypothetical protein
MSLRIISSLNAHAVRTNRQRLLRIFRRVQWKNVERIKTLLSHGSGSPSRFAALARGHHPQPRHWGNENERRVPVERPDGGRGRVRDATKPSRGKRDRRISRTGAHGSYVARTNAQHADGARTHAVHTRNSSRGACGGGGVGGGKRARDPWLRVLLGAVSRRYRTPDVPVERARWSLSVRPRDPANSARVNRPTSHTWNRFRAPIPTRTCRVTSRAQYSDRRTYPSVAPTDRYRCGYTGRKFDAPSSSASAVQWTADSVFGLFVFVFFFFENLDEPLAGFRIRAANPFVYRVGCYRFSSLSLSLSLSDRACSTRFHVLPTSRRTRPRIAIQSVYRIVIIISRASLDRYG